MQAYLFVLAPQILIHGGAELASEIILGAHVIDAGKREALPLCPDPLGPPLQAVLALLALQLLSEALPSRVLAAHPPASNESAEGSRGQRRVRI